MLSEAADGTRVKAMVVAAAWLLLELLEMLELLTPVMLLLLHWAIILGLGALVA